MKIAFIVAAVVTVMHFTRQLIGSRISSRALAEEQAILGARIARLLADDIAELMLVGDLVTMHEVVVSAVEGDRGLVYCFVVNDGRVVASSFNSPTPPAIVAARSESMRGPIIIAKQDGTRVMDVAAPILDGGLGEVRIGLSTDVLDKARRALLLRLNVLTALLVLAGLGAAFVIGRRLARPVDEMLAVVDRFDPSSDEPAPRIAPRGSDELAVLAGRLNRMMERLNKAHVEAEVARAKAKDTERLAALGTLTAGLAHEINNPLAGLKNCVAPLERSDLPEPKRREYLAHVRDGLDRIQDLVERLLDFGRSRPLEVLECSVEALADDAVQLATPLLRERRIDCTIEAEDGASGLVHADRHEIGQAMVNLLLNAAYVTADRGRIAVRLRRRGALLGIAVADDGPGIPESIRDQILDPFFTTKPVGEGTGLGLSVTHAIVRAHRGELTFECPRAGGTVVTIWLPRVDAARGDQRLAG